MTGFPKETISFLNDLRDNNDKAWFDANRDRYEAAYLAPAKQFVEALAPNVDDLVPGIHAEPKVLGSIFRINRDTRFSKDKRPYKDHVDLWFWEGDRKTAISGLFFRVSPDGVFIGAGSHGFTKEQLPRYRDQVDDELAAVVGGLEADGYQVGGETYARVPKGYEAGDDTTARLLKHSGLFAFTELGVKAATKPTLSDEALRHWERLVPLHHWLNANL